MSFLRQVGSGLIYALVSVVLIVGGLSLALAEGAFSPAAPVTSQPSSTAAEATASPAPASPSETSEATAAASAPSATPQVVAPSSTAASGVVPSATHYSTPRPTSTYRPVPTTVKCGPYAGWVHAYTVQQGDTLYHISTLYRTTVPALQAANCRTNTLIVPGEQLWVPNVPTSTPGVTLMPTFPTNTPVPTEPLTLTPIPYFTETAAPTDTATTPGP